MRLLHFKKKSCKSFSSDTSKHNPAKQPFPENIKPTATHCVYAKPTRQHYTELKTFNPHWV